MKNVIFEKLKEAFENNEDFQVLRHCEALMMLLRSELTINKINTDYEPKEEK